MAWEQKNKSCQLKKQQLYTVATIAKNTIPFHRERQTTMKKYVVQILKINMPVSGA